MQEYTRRVRRERELHSWSQEQVAEKIGTTAPNVSRWERGKTFPDTYYRQKLCELFGKSAEELGFLQNNADEQCEQSLNQPVVAQDANAPLVSAPLSLKNRNRQRMLQKVRAFWITGVLEQSLHGAVLIRLGLYEQPDAVANPWELVLRQPDQPANPLPPGTRITQVYDTMGGELLILGEPGSGKTTLLLELARDLLDRATQDETHPLPVVFNLSSWVVKRLPLADWLVEELHLKYQVPRKLAREWADADQILPLLDGLDEVTPSARTACVEAINAYRREYGLLPTVVCCRSTEYATQSTRLLLERAVVLQPLTPQQIETHLVLAGEQLTVLRMTLQVDPTLQELATTPLMLNILMLAYQGSSKAGLPEPASIAIQQRHVFATYVQRMLQRRGVDARYPPQQTMRWLAWLARQMTQDSQTEFYIERMQPDCLADRRSFRWYRGLVMGLVVGLIGGATAITADQSLSYVISDHLTPPFTNVSAGIGYLTSLIVALIYGLGFGLIGGLIGTLERGRKSREPRDSLWIRFQRRVVATVLLGLSFGLIFVLVNSFWVPYPVDLYSVGYFNWPHNLSFGISGGIFGGLLGGLVRIEEREITCVELLAWSRVPLRRKVMATLTGGIIGVLLAAFIGSAQVIIDGISAWQSDMISSVVLTGLVCAGPALLLSGVSRGAFNDHTRTTPNQGIHNSARVCIIGLFIGLAIAVFSWIRILFQLDHFFLRDILLLLNIVIMYLNVILILMLMNGGYVCIQHGVLRILLRFSDSVPWNYPRFLDYAAERVLLRKVGGGYIFYVDNSLTLKHIIHISARQQAATTRPLTSSIQPCGPKARVRGILVCCTV